MQENIQPSYFMHFMSNVHAINVFMHNVLYWNNPPNDEWHDVFQGMSSVFFNKGENCIAAGRLFLEASIHDEYVSRVVSTGSLSQLGHYEEISV